ncbi:MAG: hypothetical protein JJU45_19335 [Acidimicrobiia bacterium]|nr:hypothetical protein [Acidimicrobiia bacterium]
MCGGGRLLYDDPIASVTSSTEPGDVVVPQRSVADRRMRRLLRLPTEGPKASIMGAHNAFSSSIALSATRCLITYVIIPLMGPVIGLTGGVGAWLGLVLGAVSAGFIIYSVRRFFAADHKWRWAYASIGGGLLVLLAVQAVFDVRNLLS